MTFHEEKAEKFFLDGYNCAQAVFMAYSDLTGIDEKARGENLTLEQYVEISNSINY